MINKSEEKSRFAGRMIGELSKAAHRYFQSEFKALSIGHAQIATIMYVSRHEGVSQYELAKYLHLDKSSITSQIRLMEQNGYIHRTPADNDARVMQISLTDKTREILPQLTAVFADWTDTILDGFSEDEQEELFQYLKRMQINARKKLEQLKK
nr:MarR family transcriptional regulator [uncultured Draconibacterium sp.]